jgi:iron complex outermembrane recepter protein
MKLSLLHDPTPDPMRPYLFLSVAACTLPTALAAQSTPDSTGADTTQFSLRGITVNVARPALTTGGSSAVVIALDSMGAIPAPTMEDVLRSIPLIQIRTNSRGEAQPSLRGSEDRQITVLFDGIPLTLGWDHRTDMSIIPLTAARSITLVRGLSSVLNGPNTLGGVIEVDLARSHRRLPAVDPLTFGFALDGTGATNGSVTAARLVDRDEGQWEVRGGAGFQKRDGWALPGGIFSKPEIRARFVGPNERRLNSDVRRVDGFFSARYLSDSGLWASLSGSGYDVERGVPPEAHQDGPRLWRYPDQKRFLTAISFGTGARETGSGTGDLEASVGIDVGSTRIDQFASEAFSTVEEREESDDRTVTARLLGEHTAGARAMVRASATYADVSHDEVLTPGGANSYRQRLWSVGAETEWSFGSSSQITIGAAADGADTPESGNKPPVGRIWDYGVRLGGNRLVADHLLVHGNVSRRSRFPSLRELYSGALGRFEPNPDLSPETLVGAEVGMTLTGLGAELQLVGFHHRLADGIVRTSVTGPDGRRLFKRVNRDQVRSTGLELLGSATLGPATLGGDLTLQSVTGRDANGAEVDLEYEPSVLGRITGDLLLPAELWGRAELRFIGSQRCQNPEAGGLQPLASSRSLDASVRRTFGWGRGSPFQALSASLGVRNLTDGVIFDQCGLPQPGRTFQLQFQIR